MGSDNSLTHLQGQKDANMFTHFLSIGDVFLKAFSEISKQIAEFGNISMQVVCLWSIHDIPISRSLVANEKEKNMMAAHFRWSNGLRSKLGHDVFRHMILHISILYIEALNILDYHTQNECAPDQSCELRLRSFSFIYLTKTNSRFLYGR